MRQKLIAAVVIAFLACWSVPPGWTMSHPASDLQNDKTSASAAHRHSCCPTVSKAFFTLSFVDSVPASLPCNDNHPCCLRQSPDRPLSLPGSTKISGPDWNTLDSVRADAARSEGSPADNPVSRGNLQHQSFPSTVLRI